jgi:hypothetical protein
VHAAETQIDTQRGISRFTANQRSEIRHSVERGALLQIANGPRRTDLVTILDVSAKGLRVRGMEAIPAGTRVVIRYLDVTISGEVRYIRAVDSAEFHIGILAESATRDGLPEEPLDLTLIFFPESSQ